MTGAVDCCDQGSLELEARFLLKTGPLYRSPTHGAMGLPVHDAR